MSPEQRAYIDVYLMLVDLHGGDKVYDYIPPAETKYPFIRIGEQFGATNRMHKDALHKNTDITIHFWHNNMRQRGTFSRLMSDTEAALIEHFGVDGERINTQILEDHSTGGPLLHGVLEVNIKNLRSGLNA